MDVPRKRCLDESFHSPAKKTCTETNKVHNGFEQDDDIAWSQPDSSPGDSDSITPQSFFLSRPSIAATSVTSTKATSKRPKKFTCHFEGCDKAFDRPIRLEVHLRSHTNDRCIQCPEPGCDKAFFKAEHLKQHQKDKHSDERDYVCTYKVIVNGIEQECGKGFTTGTKFRRHVAMHEEKEATRCPEPGCGKEFRKQDTLQRHIMKDHLKQDPFRCTLIVQLNGGRSTEECGQMFPTPTQLKTHQNRVHLKNRHVCTLCSPHAPPHGDLTASNEVIAFATHSELLAHCKSVHPPTCADCGAVCDSNKALRAHMDIQHTSVDDRKKFPCMFDGCGKSFTKNGNLKVHIATVHNKSRNFICGEYNLRGSEKIPTEWDGLGCGQALSTKAALEEHVRTQHLHLPQNIRPARLKRIIKKEHNDEQNDMPLDMQPVDHEMHPGSQTVRTASSISMLTGAGYEETRPIICLLSACQARFKTDYTLGQHLEMTHGWNVDDAGEAIAERNAMQSGQFWIGGEDGIAHPPNPILPSNDDDDVAQRLQNALTSGQASLADFKETAFPDESHRIGSFEDEMLVDPALI